MDFTEDLCRVPFKVSWLPIVRLVLFVISEHHTRKTFTVSTHRDCSIFNMKSLVSINRVNAKYDMWWIESTFGFVSDYRFSSGLRCLGCWMLLINSFVHFFPFWCGQILFWVILLRSSIELSFFVEDVHLDNSLVLWSFLFHVFRILIPRNVFPYLFRVFSVFTLNSRSCYFVELFVGV